MFMSTERRSRTSLKVSSSSILTTTVVALQALIMPVAPRTDGDLSTEFGSSLRNKHGKIEQITLTTPIAREMWQS